MSLPAINAEAMITELLRRVETLERLTATLQVAWDTRIIIEQAKGILAERNDICVEDAFDLLRSYARNTNQKLLDVADALIDGDIDFPAAKAMA